MDKRTYIRKLKRCETKEDAFVLGYNMAIILNSNKLNKR